MKDRAALAMIKAAKQNGQVDIPVSFKIRHTDSFMKSVLKSDGMGRIENLLK